MGLGPVFILTDSSRRIWNLTSSGVGVWAVVSDTNLSMTQGVIYYLVNNNPVLDIIVNITLVSTLSKIKFSSSTIATGDTFNLAPKEIVYAIKIP